MHGLYTHFQATLWPTNCFILSYVLNEPLTTADQWHRYREVLVMADSRLKQHTTPLR
jgi:hypothetical protein